MKNSLNKIIYTGLQNLVGDMADDEYQEYRQHLEIVNLKRGEVLVYQDAEADSIYILLSGKLEANVLQPDGTQKRVGFVNRAETVGEMALITGDVRSATIVGYRNSILAKMSKQVFMDMCYSRPVFAINVCRFVVNRLKENQHSKRKKNLNNNICLFDASQTDLTRTCINQLLELYKKEKNYTIVDMDRISQIVDNKWKNDAESIIKVDKFINSIDINDENIVFDLKGMDQNLMSHLLDYSDIIIQYYDSQKMLSDEAISQINKLGSTADRKIRHLICHEDNTFMPSNTASLLSKLRPGAHTHIRAGRIKDAQRILRYMKGNSNSLVLGGGGAKGIAHLGIIKAIEEHEIPIDYIAGTSMGSIYAGLYAIHEDFKEVYDMSVATFKQSPTSRTDINLIPKHSIYRDKKINKRLEEVFKNYQIEDLWLPFYCISSNISRPDMVIHETGNLKDAIRASMAVPGLFKPILINNEVHVDGGVFNNIPIDVMLERNNGHIIASRVDVKTKSSGAKLPNLLATVMRSTVANSDRHSNKLQQFVDVLFQPNVARFGLLDWKAHERIFNEGYKHASTLLESMPDLVNHLRDNQS